MKGERRKYTEQEVFSFSEAENCLALFLLLRAPVEFPPAQDARFGDSGDREVSELS